MDRRPRGLVGGSAAKSPRDDRRRGCGARGRAEGVASPVNAGRLITLAVASGAARRVRVRVSSSPTTHIMRGRRRVRRTCRVPFLAPSDAPRVSASEPLALPCAPARSAQQRGRVTLPARRRAEGSAGSDPEERVRASPRSPLEGPDSFPRGAVSLIIARAASPSDRGILRTEDVARSSPRRRPQPPVTALTMVRTL